MTDWSIVEFAAIQIFFCESKEETKRLFKKMKIKANSKNIPKM